MRRSFDQGKGKCDGILSEADQQKKRDARAKNQKRLAGQICRPKKLLNADELKEVKMRTSTSDSSFIRASWKYEDAPKIERPGVRRQLWHD